MFMVNALLETIDDRILERTNEWAEEFQITTGVKSRIENDGGFSLP